MKLLINTSTLRGTGVVQVATSFIKECKNFTENEYYIFLSKNVYSNLDLSTFPGNFIFYKFTPRETYSFSGIKCIIKMKLLEKQINPDVTFSVFGPSLWRPSSPHLQGYAYPHYVYPESPLFKRISIFERFKILIKKIVHIGLLKADGDYFVCETKDVANRFGKYFHIDNKKIFHVNNTVSDVFLEYDKVSNLRQKCNDSCFRFYSLCSPYKHKNLEILNEVIPLISQKKINVQFWLTIDEKTYLKVFTEKTREYVKNIGPLQIKECPAFVNSCDALFLPTLMECFSANYPEAMFFGKPIITSNLPFAKTVCQDAALYFDPLDPSDICSKIEELVKNRLIYDKLKKNGSMRVREFGSAKERAIKYLNICRKIKDNVYC